MTPNKLDLQIKSTFIKKSIWQNILYVVYFKYNKGLIESNILDIKNDLLKQTFSFPFP